MTDFDMSKYDDWAELAIARLRCMPPTMTMCMGSWEGNALGLINEVQNKTPIGRMYVIMELDYFRAIKEGKLTEIVCQTLDK